MANRNQEDNLKKEIGLGGAISISAGQIIGAGIVALTGIGIGMTGPSVVLAFILSAVITMIVGIPIAATGATIPTTGGNYRYTSRILSPQIGFFYLCLFIVGQITIALYALSFAEYFEGIIPGVPMKLVAAVILTILFLSNLTGAKKAAKLQSVMMGLLILSLGMFVVIGLPKVDYSIFTSGKEVLFTHGMSGFFKATALLTFATSGAIVIGEMGGEMKNPGRDIPIAILASTAVIGVVYALVSTVAVGILPLEQTAFQPLTNVAKTILPHSLFIVFIVCGAMVALATTLNATFSWVTKGLLIACHDGWLPEKLGEVNEKYGTPHWILTFFYIVGLIPIVTGMSLEFISSLGNAAIQIANILPLIAAVVLPYKYKDLYEKSPLKLPKWLIKVLVVCAVVLQCVQGYFLLADKSANIFVVAGVYILLAFAYSKFLYKKGSISFQREF
ncbi:MULTISPECIES: APC family permease [Psychrilyobacter]|uniref:Amino acid permease n=1 Tax=Psychrilyobacter piezotolerans TaxID=2293438 RepID=A0ABX9KJ31_9FUSO|nr:MULTISPECIES: APC family permease [Psychrilyobacter]MCS5423033.1 APC family permease [Psychrilyobacter sp. S5]NDI77202.1 amino acid permease [Psychrilyobacter piezotolerans]RDE64192.1 amino acid permease [Psychrilyobacter sp. S5]REI42284.1 amino acid permease [Psychrilyobacter piezotolerans]